MSIYIGSNRRLPVEYQEVEYIQSSGTQRIDSGITLSNDLGFNVDFMELDAINGNGHCVFGGRYSAGHEEICINTYYYYSNGIFAFGTQNVNPYITPNTRQQCSMKNRLFTACNGNTNTFNSYTFRSGLPLYIFAMKDISTNNISDYSNARLYNLKLHNADTLVRDFVPCYRKSDSVIGLYDLVNDTFYTNQGTGTFTKGADVYTNVIQNIYIGEYGWKPGSNTLAYFPFKTDQLDATGNYTLTASGTQQTIGYKFNVQCGVNGGEIPGINFIGMWYNTHNEKLNGNYDICACAKHGYIAYNPGHSQSNIQNKIVVFSNSSFTLAASASGMSFDNRHYQAWSYDGSKILLCQDGVVTTFYNGSGYDFGNAFSLNNYGNLGDSSLQWTTFSNVIIENTGWTSQEMIDYYNQTKSNYGL